MASPIRSTQTVYLQSPQLHEGSVIIAYNNEVNATAFRRRIMHELSQIDDSLKHSPLQDEMTQSIRDWHREFKKALSKSSNERAVFEGFVLVLQERLIDPIYHAPLDEGACLGNDGFTYGKLAYEVWRGGMPEPFRDYAPMDLENRTLLTLTPHPIAREMVEWLKGHNALPRSEKLEREREQLILRQREQMVSRRRAKKAQFQQEKEMDRLQMQAEIDVFCQDVAGPFREFRERQDQDSGRILTRIAEIGQHDRENIADLKGHLDSLGQEIGALKAQNVEISQRLESVGAKISETEQQSAQLQVKINEMRVANRKKKKGWMKGLAKGLATLAITAATSWAISKLMPVPGLSVTPSSNGPMLNWIGPF